MTVTNKRRRNREDRYYFNGNWPWFMKFKLENDTIGGLWEGNRGSKQKFDRSIFEIFIIDTLYVYYRCVFLFLTNFLLLRRIETRSFKNVNSVKYSVVFRFR